jgi:cell division protein FtsX
MARIVLILLAAVAIVAFAAFLVSIWHTAYRSGRRALRPMFGPSEGSLMAPTGFQKVAYVALILLLTGVSLGWLGGL